MNRSRISRSAGYWADRLGSRYDEFMASSFASPEEFLAASGPAAVATMLQSIAPFSEELDPEALADAKTCGRRFTDAERAFVEGGWR